MKTLGILIRHILFGLTLPLGRPEGMGFLLDPSEPSAKMPVFCKISVLLASPTGFEPVLPP
jgi:hypothetical protein